MSAHFGVFEALGPSRFSSWAAVRAGVSRQGQLGHDKPGAFVDFDPDVEAFGTVLGNWCDRVLDNFDVVVALAFEDALDAVYIVFPGHRVKGHRILPGPDGDFFGKNGVFQVAVADVLVALERQVLHQGAVPNGGVLGAAAGDNAQSPPRR